MTLEKLKQTDVQLQAEARARYTFTNAINTLCKNDFQKWIFYTYFSVAVHKFAMMGVNTALIQAAVMMRAKIRIIAPGKVAVRADILNGNFKVEALPVEVPEHIAALR